MNMEPYSKKKNGSIQHENVENDLDDWRETSCGVGSFCPTYLQVFSNITTFTVVCSGFAFVTQVLSTYVGSQIPTLERQFGLSSYQSGILLSCNDMGFLICIILISSWARFVNIPRCLFYCILLFSSSGILCSLPYFISSAKGILPTSEINDSLLMPKTEMLDVPLCGLNFRNYSIDNSKCLPGQGRHGGTKSFGFSVQRISLVLIGGGMFLQGVAKAPRSPFVTVYVDDSINRRKTGFYMGIMGGFAIFGPASAYAIGAVFSRMYVTFEDVDMTPRDPRWIGAWWLGFIVFGVAAFVIATPIVCFPRRLKWTGKESKRPKRPSRENNPEEKILSKEIIKAGTHLASLSVGIFIGGILTRKFKMTPRKSFAILIATYTVHTITFACGYFLRCDQPKIVGPESSLSGISSLSSNCSSSCKCDEIEFFPLCGSDGVNYYSPCYAGCSDTLRGGTTYANCTCISDGKATAGLCDSGCDSILHGWIAVNFLSAFFSAMKIMVAFIAEIRSVEERDKSTASGLGSFLISLLAWIPIPIIFGRLIDTTCLIWETSCSTRGSCLHYDIDDYRMKFYTFGLVFKILATLLCCLGFWKVRNWSDWPQNKLFNDNVLEEQHEEILITVEEKPEDSGVHL